MSVGVGASDQIAQRTIWLHEEPYDPTENGGEANDKYNAMRAASIGKEFGVKYIVKGNGNEYQRINDIQRDMIRNWFERENFGHSGSQSVRIGFKAIDVIDAVHGQAVHLIRRCSNALTIAAARHGSNVTSWTV